MAHQQKQQQQQQQPPQQHTLEVLPDHLVIVRLPAHAALPPALASLLHGGGALASLTRTALETSLVLPDTPPLAAALPAGAQAEPGWRALRVAGPLPFTLVGVLSALLAPLAAAGVSIFSLSTFDTDHILVKGAALQPALQALRAAGHAVLPRPLPGAVRQATAAELAPIRAAWHAAWGEGRTLAELQAEEAHLDSHPFSTSGARRHYVLAGGEEEALLCSCEVLVTPLACGTGGGAEGAAAAAWHIACLYTPPQHRGRGCASALLSGLRALAGAGTPLVLYSDIGQGLYARLGFAVPSGYAAEDLVLPARAAPAAAAAADAEEWRQLQDVPHGADLAALALPPPPPLPSAGHCALALSAQRLAWLCAGEAWRCQRGAEAPLAARGAALAGGAAGLCVWAADAPRGDLVVLLLRAERARGLRALLARAQGVAAAAGLQRVRVWDAGDGRAARAVGALAAWREARVGKLPMVAAGGALSAASWVVQDRGAWY